MPQLSKTLLSDAETFSRTFSPVDLAARARLVKRSGEMFYGAGILLMICVFIRWPHSIQDMDILDFYFSLPPATVDVLGRHGFPPTVEAAKQSILAAFTASRVFLCLLLASIIAIGARLRRRDAFCRMVLLAFVAVPIMNPASLKISLVFFTFLMGLFLVIYAAQAEWKRLLITASFVFVGAPALIFLVVPSPKQVSHVPNLKWMFNVASTGNIEVKSRKIEYSIKNISKKIPASSRTVVLPSVEKLLLTKPVPDYPDSIVPTWWRFAESPLSAGPLALASGILAVFAVFFGLLLEIIGYFTRKRAVRLDGLIARLDQLRAAT